MYVLESPIHISYSNVEHSHTHTHTHAWVRLGDGNYTVILNFGSINNATFHTSSCFPPLLLVLPSRCSR